MMHKIKRLFKFKRLKSEIFVYISLIIVILTIGSIVLGSWWFKQRLFLTHRQHMTSGAQLAASRIDKLNTNALQTVQTIAMTQRNGMLGQRDATRTLLQELLLQNPQLSRLFVFYQPGADTLNPTVTPEAVSDQPFNVVWVRQEQRPISESLSQSEQDVVFQGVREKFITGSPDLYFVAPYKSADIPFVDYCFPIIVEGQIAGVVGASLELHTLRTISGMSQYYESAQFALINRTGETLTTSIEADPPIRNISDLGLLFENLFKNQIIGETRLAHNPVDGTSYFVTQARIRTGSWSLLIWMAEQEVVWPIRRIQLIILAVTVIILGLTLFVMHRLIDKVIRPFASMEASVKRFAEGDLTVTFDAGNYVEFQEISNYLNQMVGSYRGMIGKLSQSAARLAEAADEMTSTSEGFSATTFQLTTQFEDVNKNIQEVSSTIVETTAMVDSMTASAQDTSQSASELANRVESVNREASKGNEMRNRVFAAVQTARQQTTKTVERMAELAENASNVEKIVATISSIAGQTNLLALNAAIEAARAGEEGRGFAVVANEVRKLANQSKEATDSISAILIDIQEGTQLANEETQKIAVAVDNASERSKDVANQFKLITEQIEQMTAKVSETAAISEQQNAASQEMIKAMSSAMNHVMAVVKQIEDITAGIQYQNQEAERIGQASQDLKNLAEDLQMAVQRFKI